MLKPYSLAARLPLLYIHKDCASCFCNTLLYSSCRSDGSLLKYDIDRVAGTWIINEMGLFLPIFSLHYYIQINEPAIVKWFATTLLTSVIILSNLQSSFWTSHPKSRSFLHLSSLLKAWKYIFTNVMTLFACTSISMGNNKAINAAYALRNSTGEGLVIKWIEALTPNL